MSATLQNHPYQLQSPISSIPNATDASRHHRQNGTLSLSPRSARSPEPSTLNAPSFRTPVSIASGSPQPKAAATLGSELFDAIVQAADPRHPDHAAWQERYGSLSNRSSRASFSSSSRRERAAASVNGTPTSRKSLDHPEAATRRRQASRKPGVLDSPRRYGESAKGSDADDPPGSAFLSDDERSTPVPASFEGSVRSNRSASVTSSSHRRRNRRLRDSSRPKPLVPPIPPPRVTSSTNWQSTYGSPSLPTLSSPSRIDNHPSSSGNTSDNHDYMAFPAPAQRLLASPDLPASIRIAHPYASAMAGEQAHEKVSNLPSMPLGPFGAAFAAPGSTRQYPPSSQPSPAGSQGSAASLPSADLRQPALQSPAGHQRGQNSTSTSGHSSQIGAHPTIASHTLANGALTEDSSFLVLPRSKLAAQIPTSPKIANGSVQGRTDRTNANGSESIAPSRKSLSKIRQILGGDTPALGGPPLPEKSQAQRQRAAHGIRDAAPSVPPKNSTRAAHQTGAGMPSAPLPAPSSQGIHAIREDEDDSGKLDLAAFPLRRDDEFRANDNEFEMSDDSEPEENEAEFSRTGLPQLSTSSFHLQHGMAPPKPQRNPGAVRRSLDSIISPFRAGLLNVGGASSVGRKSGAGDSRTGLTVGESEPIAAGRRSFSESRFVRPFLPRNRMATLNRQARPLSKVLDHPEVEAALAQASNAPRSEGQSPLPSRPHAAGARAPSRELYIASNAHLGDRQPRDAGLESSVADVQSHTGRNGGLKHDAVSFEAPPAPTTKGMRPRRKRVPADLAAGISGKPTGADADQRTWEPVANAGRADASLPSMSSSRSPASSFSRSTSNLHDSHDSPFDTFARNATISIQQQSPRGRFGGFFSKVKGSVTPKGTPNTPSHEFTSSFGPSTTDDQHIDPTQTPSPTIVGASSKADRTPKKVERPFRARVKSLTSPRGLSSSRSKDTNATVPAVPTIPSQFVDLRAGDDKLKSQDRDAPPFGPTLTHSSTGSSQALPVTTSMSAAFVPPGWEQTNSVWEESPQVPASSSFPSTDKASRTFGRLLRRRKTQEDLDAVIDSFVPLPPKMSHADVADEAVPRSSMSSVRGFDVVEPAGSPPSLGQTRTTIRKTLSPALLSDAPQPEFAAVLEDAQTTSLGHGDLEASFSNKPADRTGADVANAPEAAEAEDVAEELSEVPGEAQRFQSPLGRFIRGNAPSDRLSRVEELSERLSHIADSTEAASDMRAPASLPASPNPRSFGEHRSVRRSISGNVRGQAVPPPTLELVAPREGRLRNASLDIVRNGTRYEAASSRDAVLESPAVSLSTAASSPAAGKSALTPKTPSSAAMYGEQLTPSWRSTSFSTTRTGRTSFSQDRDRAPVASPISPPMPSGRGAGVGQAIKRLGIKGKSKKASKGIGPSDVIVLDYDDNETAEDALREAAARPSMSLDARPSFGGGARPSFSSLMRPSFGGGARPNIEATGRNSLVAAEMVTKLLEVEASVLIPSPVTPSFGSQVFGHHSQSDVAKSATSLGPRGGDADASAGAGGAEVAGLGIGSVQWSEGMPLHKAGSGDVLASASASDGTFTSQGIRTPENGSLTHSASVHVLSRADAAWVAEGETDAAPMTPGVPPAAKSAEIVALENLLGRFPQQQKELLQDISARVAKTPKTSKGGEWDSREDLASSSGV